jgi:CreA protein
MKRSPFCAAGGAADFFGDWDYGVGRRATLLGIRPMIRACVTAFAALALLAVLSPAPAAARDGDIGCVTTAWKLIGANHKVCVSSFRDPDIDGVVCHLSQARTGGVMGSVGLAEDLSEFSLSCIQAGPIHTPLAIPEEREVFNESTSIFFKGTKVVRFYDKENNALVYLAVSRKLIDGSPRNSVSNVAISPWLAK